MQGEENMVCPDFKSGRVVIEKMLPVLFCAGRDRSLCIDDVITSYSSEEKTYEDTFIKSRDTEIETKITLSKNTGKMFDNNDLYRVMSIGYRREDRDGTRIRFPEILFGPTNFFDFIGFGSALGDKDIERCRLLMDSGASIDSLSVPVPLGTNTFVVTSDGIIVLSHRKSGNYFGHSDDFSIHVSVAEGMLRPQDRANPFNTVSRGLYEELYIDESLYSVSGIKLLGIWSDLVRFQLNAVFVVNIDASFADLQSAWRLAPDAGENFDIISLPLDIDDIASVLLDEFISEKHKFVLSSNHVSSSLLTLMHHYFLPGKIRRALGGNV